MSWVPNYRADLDADFLALYGFDLQTVTVDQLNSARFFTLCERTVSFKGVMRQVLENELERDEKKTSQPHGSRAVNGHPSQVPKGAVELGFDLIQQLAGPTGSIAKIGADS